MTSDLTFGYYDKSKFKGDVDWHPVQYKYMFGVKLDDVKVGGKALNMCEGKSGGCMISNEEWIIAQSQFSSCEPSIAILSHPLNRSCRCRQNT